MQIMWIINMQKKRWKYANGVLIYIILFIFKKLWSYSKNLWLYDLDNYSFLAYADANNKNGNNMAKMNMV